MSDTLRDQQAEVLRDRLHDLGVDGRDAEGTPDGSLWLESVQAAADDLADIAAKRLATWLTSAGRVAVIRAAINNPGLTAGRRLGHVDGRTESYVEWATRAVAIGLAAAAVSCGGTEPC